MPQVILRSFIPYRRFNAFILFFISTLFTGLCSANSGSNSNYDRNQISEYRFGDSLKQELIKEIYNLNHNMNREIFGQETQIEILRAKLLQYIDTFGTRKNEPVSLHLIGLPGNGKSAIISYLDALKKLGIEVLRFNAQEYKGISATGFSKDLEMSLSEIDPTNKYTLLFVEELDKQAEIDPQSLQEITSPLIGALNDILSSGKLFKGANQTDLSNVMVITTMNLPTSGISQFSREILGENKNFFDFGLEDLNKFYKWLLRDSSSVYKVLGSMFRLNTVRRLAPNAVILKPLELPDYKKIAEKSLRDSIERNTRGNNANQRLQVNFSDRFVDFVTMSSLAPSLGASNTIVQADSMMDQLVHFGKRATHPGDRSLNRPRKLMVDLDPDGKNVVLSITPQLYKNGQLIDSETWNLTLEYIREAGSFKEPSGLALQSPPEIPHYYSTGEKIRINRKDILEKRFPPSDINLEEFESEINKKIIGQRDAVHTLAVEIKNYKDRPGAARKSPSQLILAGFPGIGKTGLITEAAELAHLPVIRINLQKFSGDDSDSDSVSKFMSQLEQEREYIAEEKYVLLLEEIDKIFELDPRTGDIINRPLMAVVKDLLTEGRVNCVDEDGCSGLVDLRNAFIAGTMNFTIDRFQFEADPRLTTIEDITRAYKKLSTSLADFKKLLGTMFLPDTVNRLITKIKLIKPLDKKEYEQLIDLQINNIFSERLHSDDGVNAAQIWAEVSPSYKKYLFSESVIPSEAGRNTVETVKALLGGDLEMALRSIPKSHSLASLPLILYFDYSAHKQEVRVSIAAKRDPSLQLKNIYVHPVVLQFPPLKAKGKMSAERMLTAVHEFGHALAAARLGLRFEFASVISPKQSIGGYVKFTETRDDSASLTIALIYSTLASRAMERLFFHSTLTPLDPRSVGDITSGAAADIQAATIEIFDALYELGWDPWGGVISRSAIKGSGANNFEDLPPEKVQQLGLILRDMEDFLIKDFMNAHEKAWYVEKIKNFAHLGGLNEKQFYKLIDYAYPGANTFHVGNISNIYETFGDVLKPRPQAIERTRLIGNSKDELTVEERIKLFQSQFFDLVEKRLHTVNLLPPDKEQQVPFQEQSLQCKDFIK